jgi:predicted Zn-dependent protease with MMP-like domain
MASTIDWKDATPPTLTDFETIAAAAWERLAPEFREVCADLVIRVEDFAQEEVLDELDIESPFDLMGLYQGLSLDRKSTSDVPREPDMVFLYRRAILDYWTESEETLDEIITHVLVHEIGHHFGFSDADMEEIESQSAA